METNNLQVALTQLNRLENIANEIIVRNKYSKLESGMTVLTGKIPHVLSNDSMYVLLCMTESNPFYRIVNEDGKIRMQNQFVNKIAMNIINKDIDSRYSKTKNEYDILVSVNADFSLLTSFTIESLMRSLSPTQIKITKESLSKCVDSLNKVLESLKSDKIKCKYLSNTIKIVKQNINCIERILKEV